MQSKICIYISLTLENLVHQGHQRFSSKFELGQEVVKYKHRGHVVV